MLIAAQHLAKTIGTKTLFSDLNIHIETGEKIALIGRNGQGKTTLLHILHGDDHDFSGTISKSQNLRTVMTSQEHNDLKGVTPLEYILSSIPHYKEYEKVIKDYEEGINTDLNIYSDAVEYFSIHGYYQIKELVLETLSDFQITIEESNSLMSNLSGGEKRFVELVRIMYAQANLLLIDEPTNHMDYLGKERFISWMKSANEGMIIVSHDRDVLKHVDRILELKDQNISVYNGDYQHYLKTNTLETTSSVTLYQNQLKRLAEAKKKVDWGLQMRAKSKAWKIRYDHWKRDYDKIKAETVKPSFWIDQDSVQDLDKSVIDSYHKYKEKNVRITTHSEKEHLHQLLKVSNLSLGYSSPVFRNISFTLGMGSRMFIKGRNGAGKSTLIKTILSLYREEQPKAKLYQGDVQLAQKLRIGEYEQEIGTQYLHLTLEQAIMEVYDQIGNELTQEAVKKILSQYLFDPTTDGRQKMNNLSGGQKARFQLIKMLSNKPNLLLLDEPTNHLDLPSIEELENALLEYQGGIIYTSHDSYFINKLKGEQIEL